MHNDGSGLVPPIAALEANAPLPFSILVLTAYSPSGNPLARKEYGMDILKLVPMTMPELSQL
jgi:hypothetical protein